ncbi:MAG: CDP-alcohol phosphatidyltransferase family protein [Bacteroidota bacterium]
MKRHIPNFLTCCNLLCGSLGILSLFNFGIPDADSPLTFSSLFPTAFFVWAACVFDFFDGFAARVLKVSSPIGKELDSLADMVSFGLLPSLFMFTFIRQQSLYLNASWATYLPFAALLIVVCSALRLAIFNLDETQKDSFRGVPTPANALFLTGLPFLTFPVAAPLLSPWGLVIISIVFSLLLVSKFELFALKFKNFRWAENKLRFTFLILAVLLLATLYQAAIPLIILLYIGLSLGVRSK